MFVYSIEDLKSGFGQPFVAPNDDFAKRDFIRLANDSDSMIFHDPQDFRLMCIGEFDRDTGILTGFDFARFVVDGKAVKRDA